MATADPLAVFECREQLGCLSMKRGKELRLTWRTGVSALLVAASAHGAAHRLGETLTLKEHLGHAWPNELIHYDLAFAPGQGRSADARMLDGNGKEVPAQLSAVTKHPDGSIQSAQVWFLVSLQPGEVRQFTLQPGQSRAASDRKLTRNGDTLQVNNGLVGARFQLGEKQFETPIPASEAPAFLAAVQLRGGGWTGRGWFETPKLCRSYKVALVESGPVFVKVAFACHFDGFRGEGGDLYRGTAQITTGQELVYLTEEFSLGDPKIYREPHCEMFALALGVAWANDFDWIGVVEAKAAA